MRSISVWMVLRAALVAYALFCAGVFFYQRSLIYFPQPATGLSHASAMPLKTSAGNVLVATKQSPGPYSIIYFGGNAEDVSISLPDLALAFPQAAIYALHYRGYGGSAGSPSQDGLYEDGLALFDQVKPAHEHVTVMGRSLGSSVATYVASRRPAERLILVTPFYSVQDIAERQFPFLPVSLLLRDKFETWRYAPRVAASTTIVAAELDTIVPMASTVRLRAAFQQERLSFKVISGVGHNTISESADYLATLREAMSSK